MRKLGRAGSLQSRQAIVHCLVHIESWAIDLLWDIIARFGKQEKMPREFFANFVLVAQEEGRHFILLAARLKEIGYHYDALPAHDGLWDSATATSHDLFGSFGYKALRSRGSIYFPQQYPGLRMEVIMRQQIYWRKIVYREEITYCAVGVK